MNEKKKIEIDEKFLDEFLDRLQGVEGVGFGCGEWNKDRRFCVTCESYTDEGDCQEARGDMNWRCTASETRPGATSLLKKMGLDDEQITGFLVVCSDNGGYCDCEILFNSVDGLYEHYCGDTT